MSTPAPRHVAIIGGGVSGAMTAASLLRSGTPVIIHAYDKDSTTTTDPCDGTATPPAGCPAESQPQSLGGGESDRREWWRGVAYGTAAPWHSINVPAMGMHAVEGEPDHLVRWLEGKKRSGCIDAAWLDPKTHIPREMYGAYVRDVVRESEGIAHPSSRLTLHGRTEVLSVTTPQPPSESEANLQTTPTHRYSVESRDAFSREVTLTPADDVVLCTGNFSPSNLRLSGMAAEEEEAFYRLSQRYIQNPWRVLRDASPLVGEGGGVGSTVLLIGSRLTAVDVLLSLEHAGFAGAVHVVSRKGLFPRENHGETYPSPYDVESHIVTPILGGGRARFLCGEPAEVAAAFPRQDGKGGFLTDAEVEEIFAKIISTCDAVEAEGGVWQSVLDGLRGMYNNLWYLMGLPQRAVFLRRWRDQFEIRRHRVAPGTFDTLQPLFERTGLRHHTASVLSMRHSVEGDTRSRIDVTLSPSSGDPPITVSADWVVNCTGPQIDFRGSSATPLPSALLSQLVGEGLLCPEGSGIGILVDPATGCALAGSGGGAPEGCGGCPAERCPAGVQDGLYAVGPIRRGTEWETIAVREIRSQAAQVAAAILGGSTSIRGAAVPAGRASRG